MSDTAIYIVLGVALTLAVLSFRTLLHLPIGERPAYQILLLIAALLGVILVPPVHALFAEDGVGRWDNWPIGLVAGLGCVEVGPHVIRGVPRLIKTLIAAIGRWLGGGSNGQ